MRQTFNLLLQLIEALDGAISATSEFTKLIEGGISHLITVPQRLSEAEGV